MMFGDTPMVVQVRSPSVASNIIEASWRALEESIVYGLLHLAQ